MGARGPLPVPVEMRNAQGGTAKRGAVSHRANKKPVVIGQRVMANNEITPMMKLSADAQKMWDQIVTVLIGYNAITVLDAPNLTLLCFHWGEFIALDEQIKEEGRYDFGSTGQMRRSPLVADRNEAMEKYTRLSMQYALTLDSRTRMAVLDVTTRSMESDLNRRLGNNPRKTNRALPAAKREIEKS